MVISYIAGLYMIFEKADEKGWKALIPIYNIIVLLKIINKPWWFIIFFIVPIISNLIFTYILINLYKRFSITKFLPLFLGTFLSFIFLPILGYTNKFKLESFEESEYSFKRDFKNWGLSMVFVLMFVIFAQGVKTFFIVSYTTSTSAMENNMLIGDHFFVNKTKVGARLPITPLALPSYHNTIPLLNKPSYIESIKLPYIRLKETPGISRNDIAVFNYPLGDTVCLEEQTLSYYYLKRQTQLQVKRQNIGASLGEIDKMTRERLEQHYSIIYRPIDRRTAYVKRCVGLPSDSVEVKNGNLFVNNTMVNIPNTKANYAVQTNGTQIQPRFWEKNGINPFNVIMYNASNYSVSLAEDEAKSLKNNSIIKSVEKQINKASGTDFFPNDDSYSWSTDSFGPIYVPQKGDIISLNTKNLPLYKRIITAYENNQLKVVDSNIYINGEITSEYEFKMNYYWMMGDNRHNTLDSRFWGFVPEDHLIGTASLIYWSKSEDGIRSDRIFKKIE